MVAVTLPFVLAGLATLSAARDIPFRVVKRQGTLVASNDVTNFGKCSIPQIEGGLGFEGRKEFSFQPVNKSDYAHGSAQNIGIITQFVCDTLVNNCGASTAAHALCKATEKAIGAGKNNGALADTFNAAFGIKTSFATVAGSANNGVVAPVIAAPVVVTPAPSAPVAAVTVTVTAPCPGATAAPVVAPVVPVVAPSPVASNVNLGSCSDPSIVFKNGLDGRREPSFIANNQKDFNHGSALNIGVITGFIAQRFQSPCNSSPEAVALAAQAIAASKAAGGGKTGASADAWNAVFSIKTNFAAGV